MCVWSYFPAQYDIYLIWSPAGQWECTELWYSVRYHGWGLSIWSFCRRLWIHLSLCTPELFQTMWSDKVYPAGGSLQAGKTRFYFSTVCSHRTANELWLPTGCIKQIFIHHTVPSGLINQKIVSCIMCSGRSTQILGKHWNAGDICTGPASH